jgi:predicted metal-dependent phosphoesterase TrpH
VSDATCDIARQARSALKIDLHLHTTASDGLLAPEHLVARAVEAGVSILSVTDHDTVAGLPSTEDAASRLGARLVTGVEITAVEKERDVHLLGYFFDPSDQELGSFLSRQRDDRIRRVREMGSRLRELGYGIDVQALLDRASAGQSVGRPAIADALVASGDATDRNDAFARLLGRGRPAFIPRRGVSGADVIRVIHEAGGIASLAHPGVLQDDDLIPGLVDAGLDALEVWHSDHPPPLQAHYAALTERLKLGRSGGSDYHGDGLHRACRVGAVSLPRAEFDRLEALASSARQIRARPASGRSQPTSGDAR